MVHGANAAFGVPLDNRHSYTKLDWELWTAAGVGRPRRCGRRSSTRATISPTRRRARALHRLVRHRRG